MLVQVLGHRGVTQKSPKSRYRSPQKRGQAVKDQKLANGITSMSTAIEKKYKKNTSFLASQLLKLLQASRTSAYPRISILGPQLTIISVSFAWLLPSAPPVRRVVPI